MWRLDRVQKVYLAYAILIAGLLVLLGIRTASAPQFHFRGERWPAPLRDLQPRLESPPVPTQHHELNSGVHGRFASPVVDETGAYVAADNGWFYALTLDGLTRWRFHAADQIGGSLVAPILGDEEVTFITVTGKVYALLKRTGAFLWTTYLTGHIEWEPWRDTGSLLIVGETQNGPKREGYLAMLDRVNGQVKWQQRLNAPPVISPVASTTSAVAAVATRARDLFAYDKNDGHQLWLRRLANLPVAAFIIHDRLVVVGSTETEAYALEDGRELWATRLGGPSAIFVPALGRIAIAGSEEEIQFVDPENGRVENHKLASKVILKAARESTAVVTLEDKTPALLDLKSFHLTHRGSFELGSDLGWWKNDAFAIDSSGGFQKVGWR